MASDFNKTLYHAVENQVEFQMGPDKRKQISKHEWRKLMDIVMEHFANSLVAIVHSVAEQQMQVKAQIEAEKKAAAKAAETAPAPALKILDASGKATPAPTKPEAEYHKEGGTKEPPAPTSPPTPPPQGMAND